MSTVPMVDEPTISCAGGCGVKKTEQQAEAAGWARLPITGRMRCGICTRQLEEVGREKPQEPQP